MPTPPAPDSHGQQPVPAPLSANPDALRALRSWLATLGPDDLVLLQAPPGLRPLDAAALYQHLTLGMPAEVSCTLVEAGRRVHVVRLPGPKVTIAMQTTDLRNGRR